MSGSLTRRQQIAAIIETTPGTPNTSAYSASNAKHQIIDATMTFDFPSYERNIKRGTLTPLPPLSGQRNAACTFSLELAGEASSGTPTWDKFIRACGMRSVALRKVTIGAVTGGPFRHGETITQATSGATAKVFFDTYTGTTTLYMTDVSGTTDNSHVWTGSLSAASATASTVDSAAGVGYSPVDVSTFTVTYSGSDPAVGEFVTGGTSGAVGVIESINTSGSGGTMKLRSYNANVFSSGEALTASTTGSIGTASAIAQEDAPTLTIAVYDDGKRKVGTGMRGNVSFSGTVGEPVIMQFAFTGAYGDLDDAANLSGVTYADKIPPQLLSSILKLGTEGSTPSYQARFASVTLNLGHQLAYDVDASASSGVRETLIVDRRGSGQINPAADLEASYATIGNYVNNAIGSLDFTVGSTAGNTFRFQVPGLRTTGVAVGDRSGVRTEEIGFAMTGGAMSNVSQSANEKNDLLLAYLT